MEKLVVAFPELAAWAIVFLLTTSCSIAAWGFLKVLRRLEQQDETMAANGEKLIQIKDTFNDRLFDIHTVLRDHHARLRVLENWREVK
jgi:hypothetical protein